MMSHGDLRGTWLQLEMELNRKKTSTTKTGQGGGKNESCSPGMIINAITNYGDLTPLLQQLVLTAVGDSEIADVFHPDNFLQPMELRVLAQRPSTLTAKLSHREQAVLATLMTPQSQKDKPKLDVI